MNDVKIPITDLNQYITCKLCNGYFIEPHTINECLHTFCKSCLVKYFNDESNNCPTCDIEVHPSYPLDMVKPDRVLETIINKIFPNLYYDELQRQKQFWLKHSKKLPNDLIFKLKELRPKRHNNCSTSSSSSQSNTGLKSTKTSTRSSSQNKKMSKLDCESQITTDEVNNINNISLIEKEETIPISNNNNNVNNSHEIQIKIEPTYLVIELKLLSIESNCWNFRHLLNKFLCISSNCNAFHVKKFIYNKMALSDAYEVVIVFNQYELKDTCPILLLKDNYFKNEDKIILYYAIVEKENNSSTINTSNIKTEPND